MNKLTELRKFLNNNKSSTIPLIIDAKDGNPAPDVPYVTMLNLTISPDVIKNNNRQYKDGTKQDILEAGKRRFEAQIQFDSYTNSNNSALGIIMDLVNDIDYKLRSQLNGAGYGVIKKDKYQDIIDNSDLEHEKYIYRYTTVIIFDFSLDNEREVEALLKITVTDETNGSSQIIEKVI